MPRRKPEIKKGIPVFVLMLLCFSAAAFISFVVLTNEDRIVSPHTDAWQSRYIFFDNGWYIDDRIYRENGLEGEESAEILYGPFVHIDKGNYYAVVDYETSSEQSLRIYGFENEDKIITKEPSILPVESRQVCYRFDITEDIDNFEIRVVYSGEGSLKIKKICVYDKQWGMLFHLRNFFIALGIALLIAAVVLIRPGIYGPAGNRELWIDMARGIGIILVFLGHSTGNPLIWLIYGFHMPLFFILSGYLYRTEKITVFIKKLCLRYFVPYLCFCFANSLLRVPYMMVGNYTFSGIKHGLFIYWAGSLKGIWRQMPNCMPLWFLPALAVSLLLFRLINTIPLKPVRLLLYLACALIGYNWNAIAGRTGIPEELPWGQHTVFTDIAFIAIGCRVKVVFLKYKDMYTEWKKSRKYMFIGAFLLSGLSCITMDHLYFSDVDIYFNNYGNILITYMGAVSMSIFIILLCVEISKEAGPDSIPVVIGYNSVFFFAFDFWGKTLALNYPRILDNESWIVTFMLKAVFVGLLFVLWRNIRDIVSKRLLLRPFVR